MTEARERSRLEILVAEVTGQCRICEMGRRNLQLLVDAQAAKDPTFPADSFNFVLEHLDCSIRDAQGLVEHYAEDVAKLTSVSKVRASARPEGPIDLVRA